MLEKYIIDLENALCNVISNFPDAILFSGGIDTSLITVLTYRFSKVPLITCFFKESEPRDFKYASMLAKQLGAEHHIKYFTVEDAIYASKETIKLLRIFDPMEIRNSIPIYIGLKFCKDLGFKRIFTGDGADELFAGYSFLYNKSSEYVESWIKEIVNKWFFSSDVIGNSLGLIVEHPYTNEKIIDLALKIPVKYKIARVNKMIYGKYILRRILERYVSKELAWRSKEPIESGSGSIMISKFFSSMISDEEFRELNREVKLRDKEQAYYYKIFKELGYKIIKSSDPSKACIYCGSEVKNNSFCNVCGAYPAI